MRFCCSLGIGLLFSFCNSAFAQGVENSALPTVVANDNRTPAGQLANGVLELRLTLNEARWYPEDENGGYRDVFAFGEEGHAPQISGPLIRLPQGTELHLSIRNNLPLAAKVHGCLLYTSRCV